MEYTSAYFIKPTTLPQNGAVMVETRGRRWDIDRIDQEVVGLEGKMGKDRG